MFNLIHSLALNSIVASIKNLFLINLRLYVENKIKKITSNLYFIILFSAPLPYSKRESDQKQCFFFNLLKRDLFFFSIRICYQDEIDEVGFGLNLLKTYQ